MEHLRSQLLGVVAWVWATAITAASNGSVNAMHDSFTPLGSGPDPNPKGGTKSHRILGVTMVFAAVVLCAVPLEATDGLLQFVVEYEATTTSVISMTPEQDLRLVEALGPRGNLVEDESELIVEATVTSVETVAGQTMIYSDATLRVDDRLRGQIADLDAFALRLPGGERNGLRLVTTGRELMNRWSLAARTPTLDFN